jgi:plastocyanin
MHGWTRLAGLALLAAVGCGGGDSGTPTSPAAPGGANAVTVGNNFFQPAALSVAVGATVTWTWAQGDVSHNVTFDDGGPSSPTQSAGSFQRTFTGAGTSRIIAPFTAQRSCTVRLRSPPRERAAPAVPVAAAWVEGREGVAIRKAGHPPAWRSSRTTARSCSLSPAASDTFGGPPFFSRSSSVPAS